MTAAAQTAVVAGVGAARGLGATLAARFAQQGLDVFVAGRTPEKIEAVARDIAAAGHTATAFRTDVTVEADVVALFDAAESAGPLDLAVYNAGSNMPGDFLSMEAKYFEDAWRIGCFGGFLFAREALRRMAPRGRGTLLFTGASASLRGRPRFAAFAAAKAGLRALAQSLARDFGPQGIHVAHVVVDGGIAGDRLMLGRPESARERGPERLIDLGALADAYAWLHSQPRNGWTHELDLRTFKEPF